MILMIIMSVECTLYSNIKVRDLFHLNHRPHVWIKSYENEQGWFSW